MALSARWLVAILTVLFAGLTANAQIWEEREVDGKRLECMHSGLMSDLNDCGFKSDWYAYVFVGSISAIASTGKDEKELQVTPEDVFHGDPPSPLTVLTSQGACLPPLIVGDRWLFFLRQETGKPIVLDYYGNDSRPVNIAQKEVETLRRLKAMGAFGLLRGEVLRGPSYGDRKPVPRTRVVATRQSDNAKFFATTDENGRYEFQPVPVGKYELATDAIGESYVGDAALKLTPGRCWDVKLWKEPKPPQGRISGHVKLLDGLPARRISVVIINEDGSDFTVQESDTNGFFGERELRPGKYVVGINLPGAPPLKNYACSGACQDQIPSGLFYYPGMYNRSDAVIITLATDEKRDQIDFVVPTQ